MIEGFISGISIAGASGCPTASAFLARTTGLDATHTAAYNALICGLVSDGIWTKFDVLYIFATQDTTTAQLNLVSVSFPATLNGAPTFTTDRGYTGIEASTTVYINTGFNPTSGTPQFTQDSAHISEWNVTDAQSNKSAIGSIDGAQSKNTYILARFTDNEFYGRLNATIAASDHTTNTNSTGHYIISRRSSTGYDNVKNGSVVLSPVNTSTALVNQNFYALAFNFNGTAGGAGRQVASVSIGSGLSAADMTNFYNRLRAYMTAVGVP